MWPYLIDSLHYIAYLVIFPPVLHWVLGRVVDRSHFGTSIGNTRITDLDFVDDALIFTESQEVLVLALEALHEDVKPLLGLQVS